MVGSWPGPCNLTSHRASCLSQRVPRVVECTSTRIHGRQKAVGLSDGERFFKNEGPQGGRMAQVVRLRALKTKVAGSSPTGDGGLRPVQLNIENGVWTWS